MTLIFPAMNSRGHCPPGLLKPGPCRKVGFTLIELTVTILIIGVIAAVAMPQLVPLLVFSELEGQARKLTHYGSAVMAEAALFGSELTIYLDLDEQQVYVTQTIYPSEEEEGEEEIDYLHMFSDFQRTSEYSSEELTDMLAGASQGDLRASSNLPEDFDPAEADAQMKDSLDLRHQQLIYKRAKNVIQDASFLSEIGPLFEEGFELSMAEPYEEELTEPLVERIRLPEGIRLEEVYLNGESVTRGVSEVQVTSLGLEQPVVLVMCNEEDCFTVTWNPLTGRGSMEQGRLGY